MEELTELNLKNVASVLSSSFGKEAVDRNEGAVFAHYDRFNAKSKESASGVRLIGARFTEGGDFLLVAALDLELEDVDEEALREALHYANSNGATYGTFGAVNGNLVLTVGVSGCQEAELPASILAATIAHLVETALGGVAYFKSLPIFGG
jgi:hypothetical protein